MKLKEMLNPKAGTLLKGFENVKYRHNFSNDDPDINIITTHIISPSFEEWPIDDKITKQGIAFILCNFSDIEKELIRVNRVFQTPEECYNLLVNKDNIMENASIIEDYKWSNIKNSKLIRINKESAPGTLLGEFFTVLPSEVIPHRKYFFSRLYAKMIFEDQIGWLSLFLQAESFYSSNPSNDYYVEVS